jgi:diaminopimelate decarboxylase
LDELEQARALAAKRDTPIEVLHSHVGSAVPVEPLLESAKVILEIARFIPTVRAINVGGGIRVPYEPDEVAFPIATFAQGLNDLVDAFEKETRRRLEIQLEPGEFLVAEAGHLATTVRVVKQRRGSNVAIVDATANLLPATLLYDDTYYPILTDSDETEARFPWEIYGRTNQGGEKLAHARALPELSVGDPIVFGVVGAYTSCRSSQFNEIPRPAELIVDRGTARLMRLGEALQDLHGLDVGHGVELEPIHAPQPGPPPRAREVRISHAREAGHFILPSKADDLSIGAEVDLSATGLEFDGWDQALIAATWSVILAQHTLSEGIRIQPAVPPEIAELLEPILQMLYDIRCCCDDRSPIRCPRIPRASSLSHRDPGSTTGIGTLSLLSGGVDSLLLLQLLSSTDEPVEALHVRINPHVENEEELAARSLAEKLGIPLTVVVVRWPGLVHVGTLHSRSYGVFPYYNAVPHGRDLLLATIAALIARKRGFRRVAFAAERDAFDQRFDFEEVTIHRCDVQSEHGFQLTREFIRGCVAPHVEFVAPLAGVSQYRIRQVAIDYYPELFRYTHSCLWSRSCGICLKCLAVALVQAERGKEIKRFARDVLDDPETTDLQSLITSTGAPRELDHGNLFLFVLMRLIESNRPIRQSYWLRRFERESYGRLRQQMAPLTIKALHTNMNRTPEDLRSYLSTLLKSAPPEECSGEPN